MHVTYSKIFSKKLCTWGKHCDGWQFCCVIFQTLLFGFLLIERPCWKKELRECTNPCIYPFPNTDHPSWNQLSIPDGDLFHISLMGKMSKCLTMAQTLIEPLMNNRERLQRAILPWRGETTSTFTQIIILCKNTHHVYNRFINQL